MVTTYTVTEELAEDWRGGESLRRTVDHLHFLSFPLKESTMKTGLAHDISLSGEVRASFDFQTVSFTVTVTCKDVHEDSIMDELGRVQSVLQDRLDELHSTAQEHLDKLLSARGARS